MNTVALSAEAEHGQLLTASSDDLQQRYSDNELTQSNEPSRIPCTAVQRTQRQGNQQQPLSATNVITTQQTLSHPSAIGENRPALLPRKRWRKSQDKASPRPMAMRAPVRHREATSVEAARPAEIRSTRSRHASEKIIFVLMQPSNHCFKQRLNGMCFVVR